MDIDNSNPNQPDMGFYVEAMIKEADSKPPGKIPDKKDVGQFDIDFESSDFYVFRKEPYLNISKLSAKYKHVQKNKISDKLRRRDVLYFDLYALHTPKDEFNMIKGDQ